MMYMFVHGHDSDSLNVPAQICALIGRHTRAHASVTRLIGQVCRRVEVGQRGEQRVQRGLELLRRHKALDPTRSLKNITS